MTVVANTPDFRIMLDGADLSPKIRPRLVSLSISSKRDDADQLDLVLDDTDGKLALPATGKLLTVSIGWKDGPDVTIGLVSKGSFKVDQVSYSGPPDIVTIRARSADFTQASELRTRKAHAWTDTTLGAVLGEIAQRNGLQLKISADLSAVAIPSVHQSRESDMALARRLGREHDAVATVKAGKLIFNPAGSSSTPAGKSMPAITLRKRDCGPFTYDVAEREAVTGVTAAYHDRDAAKQATVTEGKASGAKRLSRVYATKSSAQRAAKAAKSRAARAPASMDLTAALGRADIMPEAQVTVSGFKAEIDATSWIASEVTQSITAQGAGFTTQIKLESAPK
ncbi:contractile injection system protein, VgrG/Pvc8 family [Sphingomonas oryzagri]|uniref:Contractile injection system protein, VgrG/Pvc8 family n=1 Tax=Sphingomonas oryzagri TaxID=3042314 RepID=A0ABT6N7U4_9SPHN|nr:contractile injection system protein, VgrG/Pvc8 family [Sphingomonas oryzagri]MDH7641164.1 contractile injection system protein, VgrG/Pvc8 family [Sphingomonas oryzagri]